MAVVKSSEICLGSCLPHTALLLSCKGYVWSKQLLHCCCGSCLLPLLLMMMMVAMAAATVCCAVRHQAPLMTSRASHVEHVGRGWGMQVSMVQQRWCKVTNTHRGSGMQ